MRKFSTLFWVVIIGVGITLFIIGGGNDSEPLETDEPVTESPTPTPTPGSTITPVVNKTPAPTPSDNGFVIPTSPPRSEITGPARCTLSGKVVFSDPNTAINDALITYDNIDSPARLIFWENSPRGNIFSIGPNIFSQIPLPSGESRITVVIDGETQPTVSNYTLTARVTYAIVDADGAPIAIRESECSGSIQVELTYR
jgi:hypothetical protein